MVGLIAVSCNKAPVVPATQDVVFTASAAQTGLKSSICDDAIPSYAVIKVTGLTEDITVDVFKLEGVIYTNSIKLPPGDYVVTDFAIFDENDVEIYATPYETGDYAQFVTHALPMNFNVDAFFKTEVNLDVLCFEGATIEDFGFAWFAFNTITVREFAFFGDFCTKFYAQYDGSAYDYLPNGAALRHDMPAIFEITVTSDNPAFPGATYSNVGWNGAGAPLLVQFPDYEGVDNYTFTLKILVKSGENNFVYKEFATFTSTDDGGLNEITDLAGDGVYDFVLGSCVPDADLILPPYMDLPETATMSVVTYYGVNNPGADAYFDVQLGGFGAGFDINTTDIYPSFCGDLQTGISVPSNHPVDVYSSLYPAELLASHSYLNVGAINWLGNNLYRFDGYTWLDLQNAIWILNNQLALDGSYTDMNGNPGTNPLGAITQTAKDMVAAALVGGVNYAPPVGGWAAVMFVGPLNNDGTPTIQLLFTLVDP